MGQAMWSLLCGRTLTDHGPGYVEFTVWRTLTEHGPGYVEFTVWTHFDRAWARLCGVYYVDAL